MIRIKWAKYTLHFILCIFLLIGFILVHELAHCLATEVLGGKCSKIGYEGDHAYALCSIQGVWAVRYVLIAGSFFGFMISSFLSLLFKKRDVIWGYMTCYAWMLSELVYWFYSPIMKRGDAYMLVNTVEECYNMVLYYAFLGILIMYLFGKFMQNISRMFDKKWALEKN